MVLHSQTPYAPDITGSIAANVEGLQQFVASAPGSGTVNLRRIMVDLVAGGDIKGAAHLVSLVGIEIILALIEAGAPVPMIRATVQHAVLYCYHDIRGINRTMFADWCRQPGFTTPRGLPKTVSLYRGTMGLSPAVAATGLHWSLSFEDAAYFAVRFADTDLTGSIVLHARVPLDEIVAFIAGTAHQGVVPATLPTTFEVITDQQRIGDAAVRCARRGQALLAQG